MHENRPALRDRQCAFGRQGQSAQHRARLPRSVALRGGGAAGDGRARLRGFRRAQAVASRPLRPAEARRVQLRARRRARRRRQREPRARRSREVAVLRAARHTGADPGRKQLMKIIARLFCVAIALAFVAGSARAQDRYPTRSIKFIVPFAAGSATDTLARLLGNRISASLGQTVVVENIAGGSGIPAAQNVLRSAPDGYTIFITSNTTHASNQSMLKRVPYD